jgi:V8-like Glu-specific endopeptidase
VAIQLAQTDFDRLVDILSARQEWSTAQARLDFMSEVFAGSPRRADILSTLNLDGAPRGVAVRVIGKLAAFGQDESGRESLGVLVNKLLIYLGGGDDADFLRGLFARYPFATGPAAARPIADEWLGGDTPQATAEKIIGENTLRHVWLLEALLDAARAVARIESPLGLGTGFMVADDLVMTNHHVIGSREDAAQAVFLFNYQLERGGKARPTVAARAAPGGLFHTSPYDAAGVREDALDYTVVQLADAPAVPAAFAPLALKAARARRDARVSIIQHPGGDYKMISLQNNFVAYADGRVVQYTTSTQPGSSGSPVLDDDLAVIAIHHAGGMLPEPATQRRYLRNEGVSMIGILEDLRQRAPGIHARVKRG